MRVFRKHNSKLSLRGSLLYSDLRFNNVVINNPMVTNVDRDYNCSIDSKFNISKNCSYILINFLSNELTAKIKDIKCIKNKHIF